MSGPLEFKTAVDRYVATIEALASAPYTASWPVGTDPEQSARGEDFIIVALRVSEDFYNADDAWDAASEASEELETERWGVVLALDSRWGPHDTLSMEEYAERDAAGLPMPPFFQELCELGYFGDLQLWRINGRRIAVSVGQMDAEEPVVLFAAVASSSAGFESD